jgi:hypothetical protein
MEVYRRCRKAPRSSTPLPPRQAASAVMSPKPGSRHPPPPRLSQLSSSANPLVFPVGDDSSPGFGGETPPPLPPSTIADANQMKFNALATSHYPVGVLPLLDSGDTLW